MFEPLRFCACKHLVSQCLKEFNSYSVEALLSKIPKTFIGLPKDNDIRNILTELEGSDQVARFASFFSSGLQALCNLRANLMAPLVSNMLMF